MRKKLFGGSILPAIILAAAVLAYVWFLSRPPEPFDPAELTPAETLEAYPGTELSLEIDGHVLNVTFQNNSDSWLSSGATIDENKHLFLHGGLAVLLDGRWYQVPHKDIATAGVGLELAPGDSVPGAFSFTAYDALPDGQYRIPYGYWTFDPASDRSHRANPYYESYVTFAVQNGKYLPSDFTG